MRHIVKKCRIRLKVFVKGNFIRIICHGKKQIAGGCQSKKVDGLT